MIKKNNKKAWLRILESGIAVMLMVGFFTIIAMKHISLPDISDEVYQLEREVLKEVSENENVRMSVMTGDAKTAYEFIQRRLSPYVSSAIRICDSDDVCGFPVSGTPEINSYYPTTLQMPEQNVYTDDYLISTCLSAECAGLPPQLLRLFVWFEKREDYQGTPDINLCENPLGQVDESANEECDGTNLNGKTYCEDLNSDYVLGKLSCYSLTDEPPRNDFACLYNEEDCDKCDAGKVTFAEGYPLKSPEDKVRFIISTSLTSGSYQLVTYGSKGELLQLGTTYNLSLYPSGTLTTDKTLDWVSGSMITINYGDECQSYKIV